MQSLYVIKCQEYFKIGVANDVESRLAQLSTGNPYPLEVEVVYLFDNAEVVEKALHQKFKMNRVRGEWFSLTYDEQTELHKICLALGGSAFEYSGDQVTDEVIEEEEEIDTSLENIRTELRMQNGEPRGVVLLERNSERKVVRYIGRSNPDFEKYVEIYKQEHPNRKVAI